MENPPPVPDEPTPPTAQPLVPPPVQPQYGEYNRGMVTENKFPAADPVKLRTLWQSVQSLNYAILAFLGTLILFFGSVVAESPQKDPSILSIVIGGGGALVFLVLIVRGGIFLAKGKGWNPAIGVLLSFAMLFVGILGFAAMQIIAMQDIQMVHGVPKPGCGGLRKATLEARIAELEQAQSNAPSGTTW